MKENKTAVQYREQKTKMIRNGSALSEPLFAC